jgi:hypothetical protein
MLTFAVVNSNLFYAMNDLHYTGIVSGKCVLSTLQLRIITPHFRSMSSVHSIACTILSSELAPKPNADEFQDKCIQCCIAPRIVDIYEYAIPSREQGTKYR